MRTKKIEKGARVRLFHPLTFGTMEWCEVLKVLNESTARVRFDRPGPLGGRVYVVSTEHAIFPK